MKITIEIDDNAIMERAKKEIENEITKDLKDQWRSHNAYVLKKAYKEIVHDLVKENKDIIIDRIVTTATISTTRTAVKKLIEQMENV